MRASSALPIKSMVSGSAGHAIHSTSARSSAAVNATRPVRGVHLVECDAIGNRNGRSGQTLDDLVRRGGRIFFPYMREMQRPQRGADRETIEEYNFDRCVIHDRMLPVPQYLP